MKFVNISDAASIAMHAMVYLSGHCDSAVRTRDMSGLCNTSEAYMSKILQMLARARLVKGSRGPNGGYRIAKPADQIVLLDVVTAIEGPPDLQTCLLDRPSCVNIGGGCVFSEMTETINRQVLDYLSGTKLSGLASRCRIEDVRNGDLEGRG